MIPSVPSSPFNATDGTSPVSYIIRSAREQDLHDTWTWRNDPVTRRMARTPHMIDLVTYRAWFHGLGKDPRRLMLVASIDEGRAFHNCLVGYGVFLPFERPGQITISINIAPGHRGQGHGGALVGHFTRIARRRLGVDGVIAHIRAENHASLKIFERAGFRRMASKDGIHRYQSPS